MPRPLYLHPHLGLRRHDRIDVPRPVRGEVRIRDGVRKVRKEARADTDGLRQRLHCRQRDLGRPIVKDRGLLARRRCGGDGNVRGAAGGQDIVFSSQHLKEQRGYLDGEGTHEKSL
jgi:hypothetical protein